MPHETPKHTEPIMDDEEMAEREAEAKKILDAEALAARSPADNIQFNLREVATAIKDPNIKAALEESLLRHDQQSEAGREAREQEARAIHERLAAEKADAERKMELQAQAALARNPRNDVQQRIVLTPELRAQMEAAKRSAEESTAPSKPSLWKKLFG